MTDEAVTTPASLPKRRTARIALDPLFLSRLLALPPGFEVVATESSNDPVSITLLVRSDDLPEVDALAVSPHAHFHVEGVELDDGREFFRVTSLVVPE